MVIDSAALATITAAVSVLGNEYLKGIAGEAGKATWSAVKSLFGWTSDPHPAEIRIKSLFVAGFARACRKASPGIEERSLRHRLGDGRQD